MSLSDKREPISITNGKQSKEVNAYYQEKYIREAVKRILNRIGDKCDCIYTDPDKKGECWIWEIIKEEMGEKLC